MVTNYGLLVLLALALLGSHWIEPIFGLPSPKADANVQWDRKLNVDSNICSSLDGPYCPRINGKRSKIKRKRKLNMAGAAGNFFQDIIQYQGLVDSITEQLNSLKGSVVEGSYSIKGVMRNEKTLTLQPGKWIKRPNKFWTVVGLVGEIVSPTSMHFRVVDAEGKDVESCTSVTVTRQSVESVDADPSESQIAKKGLDGLWTGKYSCYEVDTELTLTLHTSKEKFSETEVHIDGLFEFKASQSIMDNIKIVTVDLDGNEAEGTEASQLMEQIFKQVLNNMRKEEKEKMLENDESEDDDDTTSD